MDAPEGLELEEGAAFAILSATEIEDSFECIYSTGLTDDLFFIMRDASQQGNRQVVTVEVVVTSFIPLPPGKEAFNPLMISLSNTCDKLTAALAEPHPKKIFGARAQKC